MAQEKKYFAFISYKSEVVEWAFLNNYWIMFFVYLCSHKT